MDNVIVSGEIRTNLEATEMAAVQELYRLASRGSLQIVTSRESWRERERTRDPDILAALQKGRSEVEVVQDDHLVPGFSHLQEQKSWTEGLKHMDLPQEPFYLLRNFGQE